MRKAALVVLLGTMSATAVLADPAPPREPYVTWVEDRYLETWSWLLGDASVAIAGVRWHLTVEVPVRERGEAINAPSAAFTLATPAPEGDYAPCAGVGVIADGKTLQDIRWQMGRQKYYGTGMKTVTFTVSLPAFRRIAGARTVEVRLCRDEFTLDAPSIAWLRAFAGKVRSGAPPPAERKRYLEEQRRRDFADNWKPRDALRGEWRGIAGDDFIVSASGAQARTFRVSSPKCGGGCS